jgi:hypothetical protein
MLSGAMLSVVKLSVIMMTVAAPNSLIISLILVALESKDNIGPCFKANFNGD